MAGIVVVGGGQAGATLVETLRAEGYEGPLTLVGAEPHLPYQRPPLSKKYLLGEVSAERLHLRTAEFYAEQDIELRLGTRVEGIDRRGREIHLEGGERLGYEQLALATGSVPRRLPAGIGGNLDGVFTVRGRDDIDAMARYFEPGARLLIVGGGYIGLEAAAVAAQRGLEVRLVEMADRILRRVAAPATADYFRELHTRHGVELREGVGVERLLGTDHVAGASLTDGSRVEADFAIAGIGIEPCTWLAEAAGLRIGNGISVDAAGRTSDPHIFAAGDVTCFPYRGTRVRLESVPNAIEQAEAVANAMLGREVEYVAMPWFWSDQYDVKLQIAGLAMGWERTVTRPGTREGAQSVWYFRDGELLAVDAMNDARAYRMGKRWIETRRSPEPEAVADPQADLKTLCAA